MTRFSRLFIGTITAFSLLNTAPASAQEYQGCFMRNSAGRLISLAAMCPTAQAAQSGQPEQDLRPIAYTDAYCRAREDGYPGDVARTRGIKALQEISISQHGGNVDAHLSDPTTVAAMRKGIDMIAQICPEFQ